MLQELDDAEQNAKKLQKNVRNIIKTTLAEQAPELSNEAESGSDTEPDETIVPDGSDDTGDQHKNE
jgi:hypothetical protein